MLLGVAVVVALVIMTLVTFPSIQTNLLDVNKSYLLDEAKAYGILIEANQNTKEEGLKASEAFTYEELSAMLNGVSLDGCTSSYAYLVAQDGTMLYHPTQDKVGAPVENVVVTGLVQSLSAGKVVEPGCTEYDFKGVTKFAAYYVAEAGDFILVITADKSEILASVSQVFSLMVLVSVITVVIIIVLGLFIVRRLLKPLTTLTAILDKTAELDFTHNPEQDKLNMDKGEMGMISRAVSRLYDELKAMIELLNAQSAQLADANNSFNAKFDSISDNVKNINTAVEEIAQGSTLQAQETSSARVQIEKMGDVIDENAKNAQRLEDTVVKMNQMSEEADTMLQELVAINQKTSENIDVVSAQTNSTHTSANKIKDAVGLIRDIAGQTNLLSLNASIEAARAGEAGRGFAVVAEEIRKLADDSASSAAEIENIVQELIMNSDSSVEKMAEVMKDAKAQQEKLSMTQNSFESLRVGVSEISDVSQNIYLQTEELESEKDIIGRVVEQLASISEQNAASTQETSASMQILSGGVSNCQEETEVLNSLSVELGEQMEKFKI